MKILAEYNEKKGYIVSVFENTCYMVINDSILQIPLDKVKIIDTQYKY